MGWIGKERVVIDSEAKPPSSNAASSSDVGAPSLQEPPTPGDDGPDKIVLKEMHGRLSKNCPYIGFFHHAPSAGNRSRQTYFERDIISNEAIRKQHEVRSNPMIGNFHYGHDLYGKKMEQFQRILSQLRAKDEEREVQALLDRQVWPFGGDLSPQSGAAVTARYYRGRARSIPDSTAASSKLSARSTSATEAPLTPLCCTAPIDGASTEALGISVVASEGGQGKGQRISRVNGGYMKALRSVGNGVHPLEEEDEEEDGDVQPPFGGGEGASRKQVDVSERLEREERRGLRARAFATVVYASGDSLVKLAEKERRKCASTKRFKYTGAIDVSRAYPKSGSLDDCALLRSEVAERSRLYNDLIAEVNGFRRHFFLRQKLHPKVAYLHARRQRQQEAESSMNQNQANGDVYSDDDADSCVSWSRQKSDVSVTMVSNGDISGGVSSMPGNNGSIGPSSLGSLGVEAGIGGYYADHGWSGARGVVSDDGVPPFHTLVGPGQFPRQDRFSDQAKPGDAWMPGTVSALRTKESWRSKQAMRDFHKFKPFFVQAKTDFTATYRLLEDSVLGEGSYATVYLAQHLERGEVVAVKAVQKRLLFSDMEKKSVGREIDNQLRIVHKHVVRLYEVYETPDNVYIVLENCDCGDLEKMMYIRGRLTEIEAKRVTMQLLEALHYLHGKGIVHCDLKPQNLLFAPDPANPDEPTLNDAGGPGTGTSRGLNGRGKQQLTSPAGKLAKLCDFGLSCKVPDVRFYKQTGDINKIPWSGLFGTGGYISPEIMNQQPFGKPADLWGVGVMLYQMISGRLPFIPARACVSKPVSFPAAVWADVNIGVKDLICGLLEKDPAHRLTAAQALQHPWIQTIQHLRPSFPHFVPKQCRCSSMDSSRSSGSGS